MENLKRYGFQQLIPMGGDSWFAECKDGEFVLFSDIEEREKEIDEIQRENYKLKFQILRLGNILKRHGLAEQYHIIVGAKGL